MSQPKTSYKLCSNCIMNGMNVPAQDVTTIRDRLKNNNSKNTETIQCPSKLQPPRFVVVIALIGSILYQAFISAYYMFQAMMPICYLTISSFIYFRYSIEQIINTTNKNVKLCKIALLFLQAFLLFSLLFVLWKILLDPLWRMMSNICSRLISYGGSVAAIVVS